MPLTEDEREQIIGLRKAGHNIRVIANMLGANRKTIDLWLRRYKEDGNVKQRLTNPGAKKKRLTESERKAIITLRERGYNVTAIAENLAISRRTVHLWVRRYIEEGNVRRRAAPPVAAPCEPATPAPAKPRCRRMGKDASAEETSEGCNHSDPDPPSLATATEPRPVKPPRLRRKMASHSKKSAGGFKDETNNKPAEYPFEVPLVSGNACIATQPTAGHTLRNSSTRKQKKPVGDPCEIVCVPDIATTIKTPVAKFTPDLTTVNSKPTHKFPAINKHDIDVTISTMLKSSVANNINNTIFIPDTTSMNNKTNHDIAAVKKEPVEDIVVNISTIMNSTVDSTTGNAKISTDVISIKKEPFDDNLENINAVKKEPMNDTEIPVFKFEKDTSVLKGSGDTDLPNEKILVKI